MESAMAVEKGYMVEHSTEEAWVLHPGSLVRKRGTNVSYALVDERNAAPISLNGHGMPRKGLKDMINAIAQESRKAAQYKIQRHQTKDKLAGVIKFSAILLTILTVVVTVGILIFSGNLSLPWS